MSAVRRCAARWTCTVYVSVCPPGVLLVSGVRCQEVRGSVNVYCIRVRLSARCAAGVRCPLSGGARLGGRVLYTCPCVHQVCCWCPVSAVRRCAARWTCTVYVSVCPPGVLLVSGVRCQEVRGSVDVYCIRVRVSARCAAGVRCPLSGGARLGGRVLYTCPCVRQVCCWCPVSAVRRWTCTVYVSVCPPGVLLVPGVRCQEVCGSVDVYCIRVRVSARCAAGARCPLSGGVRLGGRVLYTCPCVRRVCGWCPVSAVRRCAARWTCTVYVSVCPPGVLLVSGVRCQEVRGSVDVYCIRVRVSARSAAGVRCPLSGGARLGGRGRGRRRRAPVPL